MVKKLSVSDEVSTLQYAAEGVWHLIRYTEQAEVEEARLLQPRIAAMVALIGVRLRDLDRVVRGKVAPEEFMAPHSETEVEDDEKTKEDEDIVLGAWTSEKRRANAQWELRRAKAAEMEVKGRSR